MLNRMREDRGMAEQVDVAEREDIMSVKGAYGALASLVIGLSMWAFLFVLIF